MWNGVLKVLKRKGWSVYKLSQATGIPESTFSNYKRKGSDPSWSNICKIADALDVTTDELRGDKHGSDKH